MPSFAIVQWHCEGQRASKEQVGGERGLRGDRQSIRRVHPEGTSHPSHPASLPSFTLWSYWTEDSIFPAFYRGGATVELQLQLLHIERKQRRSIDSVDLILVSIILCLCDQLGSTVGAKQVGGVVYIPPFTASTLIPSQF